MALEKLRARIMEEVRVRAAPRSILALSMAALSSLLTIEWNPSMLNSRYLQLDDVPADFSFLWAASASAAPAPIGKKQVSSRLMKPHALHTRSRLTAQIRLIADVSVSHCALLAGLIVCTGGEEDAD